MNARASKVHTAMVRLALALTAVCAAANVYADTLRVTAANSSADNSVYDVTFSTPATTLLNADTGSGRNYRSLVFVLSSANSTNPTLDLLVADTANGAIVRYTAPTGTPPLPTSTDVWRSSTATVPGPKHPDGLSLDVAGNLYVVSSASGKHAASELWVLPATSTGYGNPILLDNSFGGAEADGLVETVVVGTANPSAGLGVGDLLVLVFDKDSGDTSDQRDALVLVYPAASIQTVLTNGHGPIAAPSILLNQHQLALNEHAVGMDLWPADNSLLMATTLGNIYKFSLGTTTVKSTFASVGSPPTFGALGKLRSGVQTGVPYAFVTQSAGTNNGARILQFSASGLVATVPVTLGSTPQPQGLAVTHLAVVSAASCQSVTGCNPTGALSHLIVPGAQPITGSIAEQPCIIPADPRVLPDGTCPGTLNVATYCPRFGATVIPSTLCGASGPSGTGFALIQTIANGVDTVPGVLVRTEESPDQIIPGPSNPACPQAVMAWAPRSGSTEGTIPEGNLLLELTGYCDSSGASTRGASIWAVGLKLTSAIATTPQLVSFADQKFSFLQQTVSSANIASTVKLALQACVMRAQSLMDHGNYRCAARKTWRCDNFVGSNPSSFSSSSSEPNPYGDIRGRLANLFLTINSRILKKPANSTWPLPSPPSLCFDDPDDD